MAEVKLTSELVLEAHAMLGEGPVWDPEALTLVWVDIQGRLVHFTRPDEGDDRIFDVGQMVGAAALRRQGGLVLAVQDGFTLFDSDSGAVERIARVEADLSSNRMNDGKCDPAGRFWAGTMAMDGSKGRGALYRLDADGAVTRMLGGVSVSNGMAWSADSSTMYYIDTPTGRVDAFEFDVDTGAISGRRTFVELHRGSGVPDGMTIDSSGGLWVALWGGGAIHRYDPEGSLDAIVEVPVSLTTSCTFGGSDLGDLYITTASTGLGEAELRDQPLAGSLFRCRPGATGLPPVRFAG